MVKKPAAQTQDETPEPLATTPAAFDPARTATGTSKIDLTNNNLTAAADPATTQLGTAGSTATNGGKVYLEMTFGGNQSSFGVGEYFGLINSNFVVNGGIPGANDVSNPTTSSIGVHTASGNVFFNNTNATPVSNVGFTFAVNDVAGMAINFPAATFQVRNVTQNSAWSSAISFSGISPAPKFFAVGLNNFNQSVTVNFDGTFVGTPPDGTYIRWDAGAGPPPGTIPYSAFDPARIGTGTSKVNLSNNNLTASADSTLTVNGLAATTAGDNAKVYFEVTESVSMASPVSIGLMNVNETPNGAEPGHSPNSIGIYSAGNGAVYINGVGVANLGIIFNPTDWIGVAVNFPAKTIQIRNITQNSGWSPTVSFASITPTPNLFCVGFQNGAQVYTVNFDGPYLGTPMSGFGRWHAASTSIFPAFTPLIPPPLIGVGGGPPPTFPPPTPPPIGAIPPGVLVGPAIAAAAVPPSNAGIALIRYTFGSATTPPASAAFPEFTTTFPSPPIVFSNIFTDGVSPTTPPSTTTTPCVTISGNMGPPIGPALPPVVPVSRPFMMATNGNPDDVVEVQTAAGSEPNSNGEVYDDSDEENEDWVEETPRTPPKPRGRGRRK